MKFWFVFCIAAVILTAGGAPLPFDGEWNVEMKCPATPDGTRGYSHQFTVHVVNGVLQGEFEKSGAPGWISLEGSIPSDGKTTLLAKGLTGLAVYAVGRPSELTPYQFHVDAQFGPSSGSGERLETRRCSFQFSR